MQDLVSMSIQKPTEISSGPQCMLVTVIYTILSLTIREMFHFLTYLGQDLLNCLKLIYYSLLRSVSSSLVLFPGTLYILLQL